MHFAPTEEQQMIIDTTRAFVEKELYPHEALVERTGHLPMELIREIQTKAMAAGLYAANMPEDVGGAGLAEPLGFRVSREVEAVKSLARRV